MHRDPIPVCAEGLKMEGSAEKYCSAARGQAVTRRTETTIRSDWLNSHIRDSGAIAGMKE
jgi:hypothetical protein